MITRRFIVYQKNVPKPIVITDTSATNDEDVKREIQKCFMQKEIMNIVTDEDILFLRPSEVSAIMVHKVAEGEEGPKSVSEGEDLKITDNNVVKKK